MYTQLVTPVPSEPEQAPRNNRKLMVAVALIAVGLCAVAFAAGEQSEEDSVTNLLMSTKFKASTPQQLAMLNKLNKMNPKQQMLYDEGMEDEAHKQMSIAYQTFMKGKDEGVLAEYDALNATVTEEQDALVDYADEMGAIQLEVANEAKEHAAQYTPILPSQ